MAGERVDDLKFRADQTYSLEEYIRRFQQFRELRKDDPEFVRRVDEIIERAEGFPLGTRVGFIQSLDGEIYPKFVFFSKPGLAS